MSTDDRDDLVGDVADALTLDQKVQWERCARLAEGADREKIENLRVIERVLASRPVAGPASETADPPRPYGSAVVRRAVHALIAIATSRWRPRCCCCRGPGATTFASTVSWPPS